MSTEKRVLGCRLKIYDPEKVTVTIGATAIDGYVEGDTFRIGLSEIEKEKVMKKVRYNLSSEHEKRLHHWHYHGKVDNRKLFQVCIITVFFLALLMVVLLFWDHR